MVRGGQPEDGVPYLLSFEALDTRVSLQGRFIKGLWAERLGMLGHPNFPSHL